MLWDPHDGQTTSVGVTDGPRRTLPPLAKNALMSASAATRSSAFVGPFGLAELRLDRMSLRKVRYSRLLNAT